jgi:hypothetical protein
MVATMTTANNILKEIYEPKIREQLANYNRISKRMEQSAENIQSDVGGKYVVFATHVKRNSGVGARLEMEALPTAQNQSFARAQVSLAYLYGSIRLSGQTFELAETNEQAFASVLDQEVNGIQTDVKRDLNRQFFGTSLGTVATSSGTYTTNTFPTAVTLPFVEVGMVIDIYDSTGVTLKATGRNITAVNSNTSIVFDGAAVASGAAGDIIVRTGNVNREITGLQDIVKGSGILYNIDPATYPVWTAQVEANGGTQRALSEGLMIKEADDIYQRGGDTTVIWTTLGVRRAYFNLLSQQRRYTDTKEFEGGFSGLAFTTDRGDIPLMADIDCQPNTMYFLNENQFTIYRPQDWGFMDRDGSRFIRVIGFDAYDATLYKYMQLGCHQRNSQGLLGDIAEG